MNKEEILAFINQNPIAFVGTCEGTEPRVRVLMMVRADDDGILFNTFKTRDIYGQLAENPALEICYFNAETNAMVRVRGMAEFTKDQAVKDAVLEKFTFLKPAVEKAGYDILATFFVRKARASHWTFEKNMQPKEWVDLGL
jgi:uncharacterized pyridoxamine 5'-phosphate oxidase family protein